MQRTCSVRMDEVLWRRLKVKAAEEGRTVSSLLEVGVCWVLARPRGFIPIVAPVPLKELRREDEEPIP